MEQIKTFSAKLLEGYCIYYGKYPNTREHVPSKIFLDEPYPENLPVVSACTKCNQSFSLDEEYLACLLECTIFGTTEPQILKREKIVKILIRKPKLRARIEASKKAIENRTYFKSEVDRIENIIKKLSRGIAKFENSEIQIKEPYHITFRPIVTMNDREVKEFFETEELTFLPEVGSRAFQRLMIDKNGIPRAYWKDVQEDNFSYSIAHVSNGLRIRMLIRNYLLGEVIW